eukprot:m.33902 g.33902  ORF g.33902 m.33902 type:complete len:128 (+) comp14271_c0_seq1:208-591(+)
MALFLVARRHKTLIYLEPNGGDFVQTVVDTIARLVKKNPDDVAVVFQGNRLKGNKTLTECNISHLGEAPVEPITINFVFKPEGSEDDWEEPHMEELSKSPESHAMGGDLAQGDELNGAAGAQAAGAD